MGWQAHHCLWQTTMLASRQTGAIHVLALVGGGTRGRREGWGKAGRCTAFRWWQATLLQAGGRNRHASALAAPSLVVTAGLPPRPMFSCSDRVKLDVGHTLN
jgi:hypothetical protein